MQKSVRKLKFGRKRIFQYCLGQTSTSRTISQKSPDLKTRGNMREEMDERESEFDKPDSVPIILAVAYFEQLLKDSQEK